MAPKKSMKAAASPMKFVKGKGKATAKAKQGAKTKPKAKAVAVKQEPPSPSKLDQTGTEALVTQRDQQLYQSWCPLQSNLQNTGAIQMFLWNLEF